MRFSAEILGRIRERCGDDFIVGLAVSVDPGAEATLSIDELAEVVAWHDERRLMDYVTCGTGSYFDFYQIIPTSLYDAAPRRAVRRGAQAGRPARAGPGREPHPDAGRGRGRPGRRSCRHGQHRPRPDRRPASRRQGPRRPRRRGPAVHLVQPAVLGPPLARLLDLVPRQPVGRARVRMGRRPLRAEPAAARRARRRRRAGRAGGGARRGRARPPRDPRRAGRRARRPVPAGRARSRSAARSSTCSPGTSGSLAALGVEVRLGDEVGADERGGRGRRRGHRGDRVAPAGHGLPARAADGRPAARGGRAPTSCRSRTCWTARPSRAGASSSSTTSTTGAGSGPRCTSPSAATR